MHIAYEAVKSIVNDHGVDTYGSELVGLVPLSAMIEPVNGMRTKVVKMKLNW